MLPQKLQPGDKIGIVAFAKKIEREKISRAIQVFEEWGLEVVVGETVGAEWNQFAGNDELRRADIQKFIDDSSIKAIVSARGGYGSVRLIDDIDFSRFVGKSKWLIGFSDITVFHSHINRKYRIPTVHGTMPVFFENNSQETFDSLKALLFKHEMSYEVESVHHLYNRDGTFEGEIVGGNLSILYSLCGSNSGIDTRGKILFLEDLCEYMYHTDRMLQNLKRNGMFENLGGLIVGGFTDMKDGPVPFGKSIEELIYDYVKDYSFPIFTGFPAGHVNDNRTLVLGESVKMEVYASKLKLTL